MIFLATSVALGSLRSRCRAAHASSNAATRAFTASGSNTLFLKTWIDIAGSLRSGGSTNNSHTPAPVLTAAAGDAPTFAFLHKHCKLHFCVSSARQLWECLSGPSRAQRCKALKALKRAEHFDPMRPACSNTRAFRSHATRMLEHWCVHRLIDPRRQRAVGGFTCGSAGRSMCNSPAHRIPQAPQPPASGRQAVSVEL